MIPLVLSITSICLCVFGFFFFRWYIGRKTAAREHLAGYRTEVNRLTAEIDAAADRDSLLVEERIKMFKKILDDIDKQIEERTKTLKKLLDDTDRRISLYIKELQRSRTGEAMYTSLGRGIRAALDSRPPEKTGECADEPQETPAPQETLTPKETPLSQETQTPQKTTAKKTTKNRLKEQIAEMAAQGLSPIETAARLNLSLAEVDLALNLLKRPDGKK